MKKPIFAWALLFLVSVAFTGCTAVKNYSLRSYQGPLPANDYRHIDAESYGVPSVMR